MSNDFDELYRLLQKFKNFPTVGNRIKLSATGKRLKSLLLGIRNEVGAYNRKNKSLNPNLMENTISKEGNQIYKLIEKIIHRHHSTYEFNQIIINKDSTFLIHKDKNNKNDESLIFSVGTFAEALGGGIALYHDIGVEKINNIHYCKQDSKPYDILDVKNTPTIFNGKTIYHATQPFTGNRFCVVAYLNKIPLKYIPY